MNRQDNRQDNREETDEEKRKREQREDDVQMMSAIMTGVESILSRQRKTEDPVVRYSMFLDKLLMCIDMGLGMATVYTNKEEYPQEFKDRVATLSTKIQKDLEDLMSWIQHPHYSPDHPYGQTIMSSSEKDYHTTRDE